MDYSHVTTPSPKDDGFSGHACGNPLRYVLKAQSKPKSLHQ